MIIWRFARLICEADVFGRGCHKILIAVGFCPFGIFYVAVNLIEYSALEYSCVGYVPSELEYSCVGYVPSVLEYSCVGYVP